MSIDLWEGIPLPEPKHESARGDSSEVTVEEASEFTQGFLESLEIPSTGVMLQLSGDSVALASPHAFEDLELWEYLLDKETRKVEGGWAALVALRPMNAFVLRHMLKGLSVTLDPELGKLLGDTAARLPKPRVFMADTGKHLEIQAPNLEPYREIIRTLNGYPLSSGNFRIQLARFMDLKALSDQLPERLPKFAFSSEVESLGSEPIPGFDGTINSLRNISLGELNVIKANAQSYKAVRKSSKTLTEKLESVGLSSLFDLLHWLPRRYIDKSSPQELRDLVPDESSTIMGKVDQVFTVGGDAAVVFIIRTEAGSSIRVTFWRQHWLKGKFPVGTEALITGKLAFYKGKPQLNGTSIEHAKEAALLPIVPIYKQSESKGVTTALLFAAVREMFSRMEDIALPEYLQGEGRASYGDIYREIHIPTTLEHHSKMINALAYFELVSMQLLIQADKELAENRPGLAQQASEERLQERAIAAVPFTLTNSQREAVEELNERLALDKPSATLLNAEVGAGKTLVAQLACLRSVEAGYQAVLMAPTEVLAQQLHRSFLKVREWCEAQGFTFTMDYLGATTKGPERRAVVKRIKEGETQVIVGTHAVFAASVKYKNLGFVAVDEQQKFGAAQRSQLLATREDGLIPDILMQSATPIPRSVAQVFYGDVDMILMKERPPGRLPIVTEWIQEDPQEVVQQPMAPLWADISQEAAKGNQTFVITPLVLDSGKVDAASVERTYEALRHQIMPHLRVAHAHGQMKAEEMAETMEAFRAGQHDVLVASTVVEVGVDIPDATRVVVLSADRLGASSLHQIRGRVGRNSKPSKCYLVSEGKTESAQARLGAMVEHENGFAVAKVDLTTRGEGSIFSGSQSGASEMTFASLTRHGKLVPRAQEEAKKILASAAREEALEDARAIFGTEERIV